jgi:hypothetical protein
MFCFDNIAKIIIGKTCPSLVASLNVPSTIPPEIAAIVSLKFTLAVVIDDRSFRAREKTLLIKSIITAHGRNHPLPHSPQTRISIYSNKKSNTTRNTAFTFHGYLKTFNDRLNNCKIILIYLIFSIFFILQTNFNICSSFTLHC